MKTIIAGSRDGTTKADVDKAMSEVPWEPTEIVSGGARGVDKFGEEWAKEYNLPVKLFPVTPLEWRMFGNQAGPIRNAKMADYADVLVAVWDEKSRGTKNMIEEAQNRGMPVFIHLITP